MSVRAGSSIDFDITGKGFGILSNVKMNRDFKISADTWRTGQRTGNENNANAKLQAASKNVKKYQKEAPKLQAGKGMSSSEKGARGVKNEIQNKGNAIKEMKTAINEVRKEIKAGGSGQTMENSAPVPGASPNADSGKGTFGYSGGGRDISNGEQFASMMSAGPGFGLASAVTHIVGPSLDDIKATFNPEQLDELEKGMAPMARDVKSTEDMFRKWEKGSIDVAQLPSNIKPENMNLASSGATASARMIS